MLEDMNIAHQCFIQFYRIQFRYEFANTSYGQIKTQQKLNPLNISNSFTDEYKYVN